jgi:hypothetical protein
MERVMGYLAIAILLLATTAYATDYTISAATTLADVSLVKTDKLILPKGPVPWQKMETVKYTDPRTL